MLSLEFINFTLLLLFLFVLGTVVGSFLNVCIYRIPRGESIIMPGSKCPNCLTPILWKDKIPLISYIALKGHCRQCGSVIRARYWIVELMTAILFVLAGFLADPLQVVAGIVFISLLIGASFIDLEHFLIPDAFTFWGALCGIIFSIFIPQLHLQEFLGIPWLDAIRSGMQSVIGVLIGSAIGVWSMLIGEKLFNKPAFGFGDVLLLGMIGSFIGWQGALFSLFGGSCLASAVLIPLLIIEKFSKHRWMPRRLVSINSEGNEIVHAIDIGEKEKSQSSSDLKIDFEKENNSEALQWGMAIPFGPWLAMAAILYFLFLKDTFSLLFKNFSLILF